MLTLDSSVRIPTYVTSGLVEQATVLLNKHTKKYYELDGVGTCIWEQLQNGKTLRESYQVLLEDYEVDPVQLEKDVLELLEDLRTHGLVEIVPA